MPLPLALGPSPHQAHVELQAPASEDFAELLAVAFHHFHETASPESLDLDRRFFDPSRFLGFRCGARWVSTAGWRDWQMIVPGGQSVRTAAVTAVGVAPGYRRRGLMRQMMNRQLHDIAAAGVPLAALWASESGIYGRFGYGVATWRHRVSARAADVSIRPDLIPPMGSGSVDEVSRAVYLAHAPRVRAAMLADRPAHFSRDELAWEVSVFDPESQRRGWSALRFALSFDHEGQPSGFATFRTGNLGDDLAVEIGDVDAHDAHSLTRLWQFFLGIDLTTHVRARSGAGIHLRPRVIDPRAVRVEVVDALHVRIIDLVGALQSRLYSCDIEVVLEVRDELLPANAGRWLMRISGGRAAVTRTDREWQVFLTSSDLGAIYLGGQSVGELIAAGRVHEAYPGAAHPLGLAVSWDRVPYCPDEF